MLGSIFRLFFFFVKTRINIRNDCREIKKLKKIKAEHFLHRGQATGTSGKFVR